MGKTQLQCPSCQGMVTLGEITCPHCGVNLKSGESYEAQVKRARGKAKHQEIYTGGLYVGIVLAASLCIFAGYMYQRSMENVLAERADLFGPLIGELQSLQDMAAAGQYEQARQAGKALVEKIQADADSIKPEVAWTPDEVSKSYTAGYRQTEKWDKRGAKRLLFNLQAKAQHIVDTLPAS
jgi:hypothetical protein